MPKEIIDITKELDDSKTLATNLLNAEKPITYIAPRLGLSLKATKQLIRRFGLEKNLKIPRLIGVGQ